MGNGEKPYSVVITGPPIADKAMEILSISCRVRCTEPYLPPDLLAKIIDECKAHAILARMGKINRDVIEASPNLKVISKHGTGVDNIDLATATRLKIPVLISPSANYESVAEHTLAMMLALAKSIPRLDARTRQGLWDKPNFRGIELKSKTLGLVGFGRIGRRVYELAKPFDMRVLVHDPIIERGKIPSDVTLVEDLDALLETSDIVSLHCPLNQDTRHLIDGKKFKVMKKSSWLINTARGEIVSETALISAIEGGDIAAAAIDTFEKEPPSGANPLLKSERVILTPHVAGVTEESFERMGMEAARNILSVLKGKGPDPACLVNQELLRS